MFANNRILAVDDCFDNLLILEELLGDRYSLLCVDSGEKAVRAAPGFRPNLVLLDVVMPGLDGHQTCRLLRASPELKDVKVVMLSGRSELKDRLAAYEVGAVDYIAKPFDLREVVAKVNAWMQMAYHQQIEDIWQEAEKAREAVGFALVTLAAFRDTETGDHLLRMRWYASAIAEQLAVAGPYADEVDETFLQQLHRASPLHDIGKVGIDDAILRKPGPLSPTEFEIIKRHTVIGSDILTRAVERMPHADYMRMAASIARHHHERFDGAGYPDQLAGQNIPLAARIVSVADVFDALTSPRVYHSPISPSEAARIIEENAGRQFDPAVVEAFLARVVDFEQAQAKFSESDAPLLGSQLLGATIQESCTPCGVDHIEHMSHTHEFAGAT